MPKLRLTARHRARLLGLAREMISTPALTKARAAIYEQAEHEIILTICQRFPQVDMEVLKRYGKHHYASRPHIQLSTGVVHQFTFDAGRYVPMEPVNSNILYLMYRPGASELVANFFKADRQLEEEREKILYAYKLLVSSSRTFDDVVRVWPEAERLRSAFGATQVALSVTPEVLQTIQRDVERRRVADSAEI